LFQGLDRDRLARALDSLVRTGRGLLFLRAVKAGFGVRPDFVAGLCGKER
jgi:hypothetical protein